MADLKRLYHPLATPEDPFVPPPVILQLINVVFLYMAALTTYKKNHFTSFNESFEASVIRWLLEVGLNWIFPVNPYKSPMKSNLVFNICEEM